MPRTMPSSWTVRLLATGVVTLAVIVGAGPAAAAHSKSGRSPGRQANVASVSLPTSAATSLAGTYWQLLSMTKKGETPEDSSAPPDVEFCRNGEWGILHYGGRREAGTYQMAGNRVVMKYEDGELYGNYSITRTGNMMVLDDGEYVLRLRSAKSAGC